MKPVPILLAASIAGNVLFAAIWSLRSVGDAVTARENSARDPSGEATDSPGDSTDDSAAAAGRGTAVTTGNSAMASDGSGRKSWKAGEDEDLKEYAVRLRAAGLPEEVVRTMVATAIDRRFRDREQALGSGTRARPRYWEMKEAGESLETKMARLDLRREKAQLLADVMGGDLGTPEELFDSPIAPEHRELVRMITQDYDAMISGIRGQPGTILLASERDTIAFLEAERRRDLVGILSPQELADYEMINSNTFRTLRSQLKGFETTEEEFRSIYEIQRALDDQFRTDVGVRRMPSPDERRAELAARAAADEELRTLLGAERFGSYQRAREHEYQQLSALVQRVNLPESTAVEVFGVREHVSAESNRIAADDSLTNEQQLAALARLAQDARAKIHAQLPGEAGDAYLQLADGWLSRVEDGGAITFMPNGTSIRSLRRHVVPAPPKPGG